MNGLAQGRLIVLEGIDGSGKTTLAKGLAERLQVQGCDVLLTRQPGGTVTGQQIRTLLHVRQEPLDPLAEFFLLAADRAQHIARLVKPALDSGRTVISDRMGDSSLAYQGYGRGINVARIRDVNEWAMAGVRPDCVVYVRIDPYDAEQRITGRGEEKTAFEQEKREFFERVCHGYDEIFKDRHDVIIVDGTRLPEQLVDDVIKRIV